MIRRDQVGALNAGLLKPIGQGNDVGRGSLVRRLQIPYSITATKPPEPLHYQDTFKLCPNLEILSRTTIGPSPETLYFDLAGPECPPLHSLRRIDWWDYGRATRSGGNAPNIEYLSLGGSSRTDLFTNITLLALRTLCIHKMTTALLHYLCLWKLPGLSHIVVVSFDHRGQLSYLWSRFGPQLSTLKTLNYDLFLTLPPTDIYAPVNAPVSTVGLHILPYHSQGSSRRFQQHMNFLVEAYLPRLRDRGCDVVYADGLPAEHIFIS